LEWGLHGVVVPEWAERFNPMSIGSIDQLKTAITAVCASLYEVGNVPSPKSAIYLAVGCDLEASDLICRALVSGKLAEVTSDTVQLTAAGFELGRKCSAIYASAKARG
jgi:hypothetical protein